MNNITVLQNRVIVKSLDDAKIIETVQGMITTVEVVAKSDKVESIGVGDKIKVDKVMMKPIEINGEDMFIIDEHAILVIVK